MKIKFIKDQTVNVIDIKTENVYDKLYRSNDVLECDNILDVSTSFCNIDIGDITLIDVKKDSITIIK